MASPIVDRLLSTAESNLDPVRGMMLTFIALVRIVESFLTWYKNNK